MLLSFFIREDFSQKTPLLHRIGIAILCPVTVSEAQYSGFHLLQNVIKAHLPPLKTNRRKDDLCPNSCPRLSPVGMPPLMPRSTRLFLSSETGSRHPVTWRATLSQSSASLKNLQAAQYYKPLEAALCSLSSTADRTQAHWTKTSHLTAPQAALRGCLEVLA